MRRSLHPAECPVCDLPQPPNAAYCPGCGQRHRYGRLTLRSVLGESFAQITNFDRGFGHNLIMLYRAPGTLFRDLVARRNGRYQNIIRFTLIVTTLSVLAYQLFGIYDAQFSSIHPADTETTHAADAIDMEKVMREITNKYMSLLYFLSIPFSALLNRLLYWKMPFNLAEHSVLACIQASGGMLIVLVADFLNFGIIGGNGAVMAAGYTVYLIYLAYCLRSALGGSWWGAAIKATLNLVLSILMVSFFTALLVPVFLDLYGRWAGPEAVDAVLAPYRYQ